eukprot:scaffold10547_cov268-Chaetoceros_neogracile.AAC.9
MAISDLCDALKKHALATSLHSKHKTSSSMPMQDQPMTSTNDESSSPQMIDAASEKKICEAVLHLVDDTSNDVQAIAVKTLGVLVTCVHEDQVVAIAERLSALVLDEKKSALRDVYAIGLRTLVKTVPMNMGDIVSSRLAAGLLDGIKSFSPGILTKGALTQSTKEIKEASRVAEEITLACLEILTELLARFGALSFITRQHLVLLEVTLRQLACESDLVRKRAGQTIGSLAVVISDQLLGRLVESLLSQIDKSDGVGKSGKRKSRRLTSKKDEVAKDAALMDFKPKDTRALIRTMCTVAGLVGHRLGQEQIDRLVPIFSRFCDPADAIAGDDLNDDDSDENDEMEDSDEEDEAAMALANELREACLSGFESFVLRKPVEIQPHLPSIIHSALAYMRHDPNYSYGDENEEEKGSADVADEEDYDMNDDDDDEYDDEYEDDSDDDDDTWKVRRSTIRTLTAVVKTSAKDPSKLWTDEYAWRKNKKWTTTLAGALVKRFKERDENCRVDIVECFTHLLTNTIEAANRGDIILKAPDSMDMTGDVPQTVIDLRTKFVPIIVKGCESQLSAKKAGSRTKSAALALLSSLCSAPGGIGNAKQIRVLFEHIKLILSDSASASHGTNKTLKLDSLHCVHVIITSPNHAPEDVQTCILDVLLIELCKTMQENWYKITAETSRVLAEVPKLLVLANASAIKKSDAAKALYDAIEPRLAVHDADQEVKECSLVSAASLLSNLHQHIDQPSRERLLSLILLRLKNETTRISAIKTISAIVRNGVDMSTVIHDMITELSSLLRQNSRSVKQSTLQCLETVVTSRPARLDASIFGLVLKELSNVIVDSDLHISHLSLKVCHSILDVGVASVPEIKEFLLPSLLNMSKSSLLQDKALDSLLIVMENLVSSKAVDFQELLVALKEGLPRLQEGQVHGGGVRLSIANIAQCIAAITAATSEDERIVVVQDLLSSLESLGHAQSTETSPSTQLALRVAGDLGRRLSLGAMPGVAERLQNVYMIMFDSDFEDIKNSAAYGLGRASVCSKKEFLPKILASLEENDQKKQYLLLSGLRELIYCHQQGFGGDIAPSIQHILPHLNNHFADKEEGVRTMVADCMGCLACLEPAVILPQLQKLILDNAGGKDPTICTTVLTSVKYAIAGKCDTQQLLSFMPIFLELLKEEDISVKNACLLMIYSAVHHKPQLVLTFMEDPIIPALYELAQLKQERTVDLGPFKQKVDDALPVRKAALSIFSTCLDKCPEAIDIPGFMPILALALADKEDVQLQAHQILISTSSRYPDDAAAAVENFVVPLEKTMNKKMGNKKGAELERATEWIKSAVRVMIVLSRVTDAMK